AARPPSSAPQPGAHGEGVKVRGSMLGRAAVTLTLAGVATIGVASQVEADSTSKIVVDKLYRGYSEFDSDNPTYDEVLWAGDARGDGWGVLGYWKRGSVGGVCVNEFGKGTRARCDSGISFPENK